MTRKIELKPGSSVDIIVDTDDIRETIDVRRAVVYETEGPDFVLSQTTPPLSDKKAGEKVIVTFLAKGGEEPVRMGFHARLAKPDGNYKLVSGMAVEAVFLTKTSAIREQDFFNLRMHHRISPGFGGGIEIFIGKDRVNIIDISVGGAKFSCRDARSLETGKAVSIVLAVGDERFYLRAKVIRTWASAAHYGREALKGAVIQFLDVNKRLNSLLSGKIFAIERGRISRGLGMKRRANQ